MAYLCQAVQLQVHPSSVAAVHHLCSRLSLLSLADICLILQLRPLPRAVICSLTGAIIAQRLSPSAEGGSEGSAVVYRAARSSPPCPLWLSTERTQAACPNNVLTRYVLNQSAPVMLDSPAGHLELMRARGAGEAAESVTLKVLQGSTQAKDLEQQPWPGLGILHCAQLQGQGICPQRQATVKAGNVCLALHRGMIPGIMAG